ncbi:(2Fe-2S)-binding protein, partial [Clostridium perfringens]|uniref:(2Fe-2S)-binding protein n=1 Tax=Clostridium perfringens TaxID=1502 RepID=UPI003D33AA50
MYLNHRFWDNMVEYIKINKDEDYIGVKFWRKGIVEENKIAKIKEAIKNGAHTVEAVAEKTGATK